MNHRRDEELRRLRAAERRGSPAIDPRHREHAQPPRNASPWEIGAAHWNQRDLYTANASVAEDGYRRGPSLHPDEGSVAYRRHFPHDHPSPISDGETQPFYEREAWPWYHYKEPPWRKGRFAGRGPKGWAPSGARIRDEVCDSLARHGDLDATDIEVTVQGTEVTLEGTVSDQRQRRLAEYLAIRCTNVSDVHNRLKIRPHDDPGDADVAFVAPLRAL